MISSRYALPVILICSLALVPTVIHSYIKAKVDDGMSTANISTTLNGLSSKPYTRHNAEWVRYMFDSEDWIERIYQTDSGNKTRLFVARSYDHKRLYHHPELGLSHGSNLKSEGIVMLDDKQEIPVHLLRNSDGQALVAYVLLYNGRYIQFPLKHQIGESLKLLASARRPMTLFYIHDAKATVKDEFAKTASAKLLKAAIRSFLSGGKSGL